MPCTAWGIPTYNVKGWKGPCYLITDGHYQTFEELMTKTQWENYGTGNDPRCEHCMVHCGYEPSSALGMNCENQRYVQIAELGVSIELELSEASSGYGSDRVYRLACGQQLLMRGQPCGRWFGPTSSNP